MRRLIKNKNAGITTYVLLMFGMMFMLYLFSFNTIWDDYQQSNDVYDKSDTDAFSSIFNLISRMFSSEEGFTAVAGGLAGIIGLGVFTRILFGSQTTATILQYSIPVILLVTLNIFIFPLGGLSKSIQSWDVLGISFSLFLFLFFNILFILSVLEFIRGNA